jgi:hypothetical protein
MDAVHIDVAHFKQDLERHEVCRTGGWWLALYCQGCARVQIHQSTMQSLADGNAKAFLENLIRNVALICRLFFRA